jgi:hypothetical protein
MSLHHSAYFDFETGPCCITQTGFKFVILLPQSPKYWDYGHVPPYPAQFIFFTNLY